MTDPYARPAHPASGEPTVPLAPEPDLTGSPHPATGEATAIDPLGGADPWSSGPGLGAASTPDANASDTAPDGSGGFGYPPPARYSSQSAPSYPYATPLPAPAPVQPTPPAWPTAPATIAPAQPGRPNPPANFQQPPYSSGYPEPNGPANLIGTPGYPVYAPSAYAGQNRPVIADPVAYDYGYNRPMGASTHPQAATSMVLGILGLLVFGPLAPVAWYQAAKARREMSAEPYRWRPSGMITAGLVMGIIGTVLLGLAVALVMFVAVIAAFAA